MRKAVSGLATAAVLALLAVPASAQTTTTGPYTNQPKGMTVTTSVVTPGGSLTVAGEGADAGATVTITMSRSSGSALGSGHAVAAGAGLARALAARPLAQGATTLGRTTAAADGSFQTTVTIPASTALGVYTLTATSSGEVLGLVTIRVAAASTGGLPFTGANVLPGLAAGAALIVAGGLLLLSIKRRRRAA
jgi:LPXTG cell wall anchor motif